MIVSNAHNTPYSTISKSAIEKKTDEESSSVNLANKTDTFEAQPKVSESVTYQPPKKLTSDQIEELQRQREESNSRFLAEMVKNTALKQSGQTIVEHNGIEMTSDSSNLLTEIFGSLDAAYPPAATTPEGALANISEGGAYSVESVSERILLMATTLAGDDPNMLIAMRDAVKEGFEAAGLNLDTGEGMPDITMDTYNHVMNEFDKLINGEDSAE